MRAIVITALVLAVASATVNAQTDAPPPAPAETLAQKDYWANQLDYTQRTLDSISASCGGSIAFAYDRASWWAQKDALAAKAASPNGRCDDVLNALVNICSTSSDHAATVLTNVTSIECGFGGMDSGFRIDLSGGKLRYDVELNRPNVGEEVENYLKGKM